jgi:hypothetical protein
MNLRYFRELMTRGEVVQAEQVTALGLPAVNADIAAYTTARHVIGPVNKTILTFAAMPVLMVDNTGVTAYGGRKLLDFPVGAVVIDDALLYLTKVRKTAATTVIADAFDGDVAVGSATATNTALASKDLAAAWPEQNIIKYTTMPQAAATTTPTSDTVAKAFSKIAATKLLDNTGGTAADTIVDLTTSPDEAKIEAAVAALADKANLLIEATGGRQGAFLDGTSTAVDMFLNFLIDDADHDITTETPYLYCTGTLTFFWKSLGDY